MRKALVVLACLAIVPAALGDYTFSAFSWDDVGQTATSTHGEVGLDVTGVPVGTEYTDYFVTYYWEDPQNNGASYPPYSTEAKIQFLDAAYGSETVTYLSDCGADNGASSDDPIQLEFSGSFDTPYIGGDDLWFIGRQSYSTTTADWTNIEITLKEYEAPEAPDSIAVDVPSLTDGVMEENGVHWYTFTLADAVEDLTVNTIPSLGIEDTEIALFDAVGDLIDTNDDIDYPDNILSEVVASLDAGQYYVAVTGYGYAFADGWSAVGSSSYTGDYTLGVGMVPEPATLALLAIGGLALIRRR